MELETSQLEPSHQQNLQEWLHQPHFETLIGVLKSKAFEKEVEAANCLTKWQGGLFPDYQAAALESARKCRDINCAIEVLIALKNQQEPYTRATAAPN